MTKAHRTVAFLTVLGGTLALIVWAPRKPPCSDPPLDQATRERITAAVDACLVTLTWELGRNYGPPPASMCAQATAFGARAVPVLLQRAREARDPKETGSVMRLLSQVACRRFGGKTPQESLGQAEAWWKGARGQRRDNWILLGLAGRKGYDRGLAKDALLQIQDPTKVPTLLSAIHLTEPYVGAQILERVWFRFHDGRALDFVRHALRPVNGEEGPAALAFIERAKLPELYPLVVGAVDDYVAHSVPWAPRPNPFYVRNPTRRDLEARVFLEAIRICGSRQITAAIPGLERAARSPRVVGDDTLIIRTLAQLEGEAYAPRLIELLQAPEARIRAAAAAGLFWAGRGDLDVPAMVAAFGDRELLVRRSLAISLGAVAKRSHSRAAVASVVGALLTELARPDFEGSVLVTDALQQIADHVFPRTRKPYQCQRLPPSTVPGKPYAVWQHYMLAYWCEWTSRVLPEFPMKACVQLPES
jgi:hypothetical protein